VKPEPHPPKIAVKLPDAPSRLARASVEPMTPSLDPSKMSPEALAATMWVTLQELKKEVGEIRDNQKWILRAAVGGLLTALGALVTALVHLVGAYLTVIGQHAKP
jgi:hypothetical protein